MEPDRELITAQRAQVPNVLGFWFENLGPDTPNIGYLDPLGKVVTFPIGLVSGSMLVSRSIGAFLCRGGGFGAPYRSQALRPGS